MRLLAIAVPEATLTGGAALAAFYTQHRVTRDLDLFFHDRSVLTAEPTAVENALQAAGIAIDVLQRAPAFHRFRATADGETTLIDLVADPVAPVDEPRRNQLPTDSALSILTDSPHEILVNKLSALLGRAEVRDLQDVRALLGIGESLHRATADAPRKDGGFSPLTLAWVLSEMEVSALARVAQIDDAETHRLTQFRDALIEQLSAMARPD